MICLTRSSAVTALRDVASRVEPFVGRVGMVGSALVVDQRPVCFINASDSIVVHAVDDMPAATFTRAGSEAVIASLILTRFVARKAA